MKSEKKWVIFLIIIVCLVAYIMYTTAKTRYQIDTERLHTWYMETALSRP